MALNCFRFLNFSSFEQVDKLSLKEYELLMKAIRLRQVDIDYRNHLQAWLNFAARAKKKAGKFKEKPAYPTFDMFYKYESEIEKITKPKKSVFSGIGKLLKKGGEDNG